MLATAANSKALWYLTRATGLVSLLLLTASVVLGIIGVQRWKSRRWPRFLTGGLHRSVSLLAVAFLAVHVVTAVTDSFVTIRWVNVFVPFTGTYRPVWLGLGAVASDLLIALIITSVARHRIGYRVWRAVHWATYACWPVALIHGLGTGTDARQPWALATFLGSLAAVSGATWWRLSTTDGLPARRRALGVAASVAVPFLALSWLVAGPLQPGWAAKAGTPAATARVVATPPSAFAATFTASLAGTASETQPDANGNATVAVAATLSGQVNGVLAVTIAGPALPSGGVTMTSSHASLGPANQPNLYTGQVTALAANHLTLRLTATTSVITASVNVAVDANGLLTGTIQSAPTTAA